MVPDDISKGIEERGADDDSSRRAEEAELWRRFSSDGDEDARDELIVSYRPLVFWLARRFTVRPSSYQDLIQEGMLALIRAVDRFEPERHLRFTTYAFHRIRGQMINFLQRSESRAPVPVDDEYLVVEDPFSPDVFETMLAVLDEMKRLPEREESVVRALLIDGKNAREVALERGIDVSHVYRLRRNALAKLRRWLGEEATNEG
ncbi:MAG: sigma-70 family RNA polymerase sigma factor [Synergistota bacterium]|nr:sigma-70 family RNA polymerase sigma factor [Synergistota bacterium]